MEINDIFRQYVEEAIGHDNALVAFSALDSQASVSVRRNPFKACAHIEGRQVPWSVHGLMLESRPVFTLDPFFHAGAYYVQDSSSMFVGHVFRNLLENFEKPSGRPVRVLDLCAAPGGKTTDLCASLRETFGDGFILVSNEIMKARVGILADNVALWGDPSVTVTSDDPKAFASMPGFFDIIVADVPCSGEGMFRKDAEAVRQWSPDNVALCEARQRRIIADVWPSLAENGILVYSTCTFNRRENDGNVEWVMQELGAECLTGESEKISMPGVIKTARGYSLVPGHVEGEGQYCAALVKTSPVDMNQSRSLGKKQQRCRNEVRVPDNIMDMFDRPVSIRIKGELITAVPQTISQDVAFLEQELHLIAAGCAVGTVKGKDLVPDADLALNIMLRKDAFPIVDVDKKTALAYLHRDPVKFPEAPKGYLLLRYEGAYLGFVKNLGNRCNSLYPQSRRIRMNIV